MSDFPTEGVELTHILVVSNLNRSKNFYSNILGATVFSEYGGTSCVLKFQSAWLLIVTGGEPTKDKPEVKFSIPKNINHVSHSMTIKVKDCQSSYNVLKSRGAKFLTPPVDWDNEIRCFFRDPDGHLLEISETK